MFIGDKRKNGIIRRVGACQRTASALVAAAMGAGNGLLASLAAGQCTYDVTVIQAPACPSGGHPATIGLAINEHSHVVGYQLSCGLGGHLAFLWTSEEGYQVLPVPPGAMSMLANDISDDGTIVGTMHMFDLGDRGFVYDPKTQEYTILHPVFPDSGWSRVNAINDAGMVVGARSISGLPQPQNGFVWSPADGFTDVGIPIPPESSVSDVNPLGIATGWSGTLLINEAFVWNHGEFTFLGPIPGGISSTPGAINAFGQIAGAGLIEIGDDRFSRAFLWDGDRMLLLGTLPGFDGSTGRDLNDIAQVVGQLNASNNPNHPHAFLWQNGEIYDINDLIEWPGRGEIQRAFAISEAGRIVADGSDIGDDSVTFLLTPIARSAADLDGDCDTDFGDLIVLLEHWDSTFTPADFDADGIVGFTDLLFLLAQWS